MAMFTATRNSVAYADFKPGDGGWIFRAPVPWILGPRPHYLLTGSQKARVEQIYGRIFLVFSALALALILLIIWPSSESAQNVLPPSILGFPRDTLAALVCGALGAWLQSASRYLALRSLLRNAPQTFEQITFRDRLRAHAARHSRKGLKFAITAWVFVLVGGFLNALMSVDIVFSFFMILAAGASAIYFYAMLKTRSSDAPRQETW
jgi:hypothetical protein